MFEYGIGGQERQANNANEGISDIPLNRTLLMEKLTAEAPVSPEIVYDLKNISEVFGHFQPEVEAEFETAEGSQVNETIRFRGLSDFGKNSLIGQSQLLTDLNTQSEIYQKIARQLKTNKIFISMLGNTDAKAAYVGALEALITELEEAEQGIS
jgi:hypothetical protein